VRAKNVGKKIVAKNCEKTFFFIFTRISCPKNGGKTRETIFPETHQEREQKMEKKIVAKSAKKRFLYSYEYRDKK